jgi:NADPH:quinone reductase-like Zn-dependent oxidoreductase
LPVTAVTAWHCLFEHGSLVPGETVVVLGTGGVSIASIQFARSAGARVIAVTRGKNWTAQLQSALASDVIVDTSGEWPKRVIELTSGRGADVVVDVVGADSVGRSIEAIRDGGLVHLVGYAAGTEARFDIFEAIRRGATIRVATAGSRQSFESLVRLMEGQKLRPVIDRTFAVSDFRSAFDYFGRGGHFGKVALTF